MTPFAWGCLVGWLLFVPSAWSIWFILRWVSDHIDAPSFGFGRNACLRYFKAGDNVTYALEFLQKVGMKTKYLGGRWYWVTRAKE